MIMPFRGLRLPGEKHSDAVTGCVSVSRYISSPFQGEIMRRFKIMTFVLCFVLAFSALILADGESDAPPLQGKKALLIIASKNFKGSEYSDTKKVLEDAGVEVKTAASGTAEAVSMNGKVKVTPDIAVDNASASDYDAVIVIGGMGVSEYYDNDTVHKLLKNAVEKGKIVAAICLGPIVLAEAGILKDRKATCYGSRGKKRLEKNGAETSSAHVVRDGKIVTADGPAAAEDFGKKIVEVMKETSEPREAK